MVFDTELGWSRDVRSRSGRDVAGIDDLAGTDINWSYWTLCPLMSEHILLVVVKSCTSKAKYCGTRVEWISHPSPEGAHVGDLADDLRPRRSRASISINGSDRIGRCLTPKSTYVGRIKHAAVFTCRHRPDRATWARILPQRGSFDRPDDAELAAWWCRRSSSCYGPSKHHVNHTNTTQSPSRNPSHHTLGQDLHFRSTTRIQISDHGADNGHARRGYAYP